MISNGQVSCSPGPSCVASACDRLLVGLQHLLGEAAVAGDRGQAGDMAADVVAVGVDQADEAARRAGARRLAQLLQVVDRGRNRHRLAILQPLAPGLKPAVVERGRGAGGPAFLGPEPGVALAAAGIAEILFARLRDMAADRTRVARRALARVADQLDKGREARGAAAHAVAGAAAAGLRRQLGHQLAEALAHAAQWLSAQIGGLALRQAIGAEDQGARAGRGRLAGLSARRRQRDSVALGQQGAGVGLPGQSVEVVDPEILWAAAIL
jgi:hypothetical protein